jgi:hypothetical protein
MVYIPFLSLLGLQAALDSFVSKQSALDTALITGEDFVDPKAGGGSLLDHDSGSGLGEPLNVSLLPFLFSVPRPADHRLAHFLTTCLGTENP